jgi:hypothetical protein
MSAQTRSSGEGVGDTPVRLYPSICSPFLHINWSTGADADHGEGEGKAHRQARKLGRLGARSFDLPRPEFRVRCREVVGLLSRNVPGRVRAALSRRCGGTPPVHASANTRSGFGVCLHFQLPSIRLARVSTMPSRLASQQSLYSIFIKVACTTAFEKFRRTSLTYSAVLFWAS